MKTTPEEKEAASSLLQAVMLRIASGLPPGQSRFTIIDPLGLGKQFAGFMHLADHDELLVSSRIWTEPGQIDKQLELITEQMEMVIQKYLRNESQTLMLLVARKKMRCTGDTSTLEKYFLIQHLSSFMFVQSATVGPNCEMCLE